jgi:hypothetical protein
MEVPGFGNSETWGKEGWRVIDRGASEGSKGMRLRAMLKDDICHETGSASIVAS